MSSNIYLKIDSIDGESEAKSYEKQIEIFSWSHGFSQPTSSVRASSGATVEKAHHGDLSVTKNIDSSTDGILKSIWTGNMIKEVTITCLRSDGNADNAAVAYLVVKMEQVIISSYSISGGGGALPAENMTFNYGKVTYTYDPQKKDTGDAGGKKVISANLVDNTVA